MVGETIPNSHQVSRYEKDLACKDRKYRNHGNGQILSNKQQSNYAIPLWSRLPHQALSNHIIPKLQWKYFQPFNLFSELQDVQEAASSRGAVKTI